MNKEKIKEILTSWDGETDEFIHEGELYAIGYINSLLEDKKMKHA